MSVAPTTNKLSMARERLLNQQLGVFLFLFILKPYFFLIFHGAAGYYILKTQHLSTTYCCWLSWLSSELQHVVVVTGMTIMLLWSTLCWANFVLATNVPCHVVRTTFLDKKVWYLFYSISYDLFEFLFENKVKCKSNKFYWCCIHWIK